MIVVMLRGRIADENREFLRDLAEQGADLEDMIGHAYSALLEEGEADIQPDQRQDREERGGERMLLGHEDLARRLADDEEQHEVERRDLPEDPVAREPEHQEQERVEDRRAQDRLQIPLPERARESRCEDAGDQPPGDAAPAGGARLEVRIVGDFQHHWIQRSSPHSMPPGNGTPRASA